MLSHTTATPSAALPFAALPGTASTPAAAGGRFADELRRLAPARPEAGTPRPGAEPPVAPRERLPDAADRAERRRLIGPPEAGHGGRRDDERDAAAQGRRQDGRADEPDRRDGPRADDPARPGRESPARKALARTGAPGESGTPGAANDPMTTKPGPQPDDELGDEHAAAGDAKDASALSAAPGSAAPTLPEAPRTPVPLPAVVPEPGTAVMPAGSATATAADAAAGGGAVGDATAPVGQPAVPAMAAVLAGPADALRPTDRGHAPPLPAEPPEATTNPAADRAADSAGMDAAIAAATEPGAAGTAGKPAPRPLPIELDMDAAAASPQPLPGGGEPTTGPLVPTGATAHAQPQAPAATASAPTPALTHEARLTAPPDSRSFAPALSHQVKLWVRDGVQQAQLQLNPADLGPIQVTIELQGRAASVEFHAAVAATREALQAALPQLAGELHEAGYTLAGGGVFDGADRGARSGDERNGMRRRTAAAARSDPTGEPTSAVIGRRRERGLVDLYA